MWEKWLMGWKEGRGSGESWELCERRALSVERSRTEGSQLTVVDREMLQKTNNSVLQRADNVDLAL